MCPHIDRICPGGIRQCRGRAELHPGTQRRLPQSVGPVQQPEPAHETCPRAGHSLTTDLSMLAADLAIDLIASGQEKKSEEQDLAPNKKRGPRL